MNNVNKKSLVALAAVLTLSACGTQPAKDSQAPDQNVGGGTTMDDSTKTGVTIGLGSAAAAMLYCNKVLKKPPGQCLLISVVIGSAAGYAAKKIDESMASSIQRLDCPGALKKVGVKTADKDSYRIDLGATAPQNGIAKPGEKVTVKPFYYVASKGAVKIKTAFVINGSPIDSEKSFEKVCGGYEIPDFEVPQVMLRSGRNDIAFEILDATNPKRTVLATSALCISVDARGQNFCK